MSLQHFFLESQVVNDGTFKLGLSSDDLHHFRVLRLKNGEHIGIIDAHGVYFECEIMDADNLVVRVCKRKDKNFEYKLSLCPGLAKANKLDEVIKACTEIGIQEFYPLKFERSVVKLDNTKEAKRLKRWRSIAKSAAMQSGQFAIPNVNCIQDNFDFLKSFDTVYVFWEEADDIDSVKNPEGKNIAIVIGPEGGITKAEIEAICVINPNTKIVSLGDSILRTETANIAACSILNFNLSC